MTQNRDTALDHLAAVAAMKDSLDAVRAEPTSTPDRHRRIDRLSAELRHGQKLALIYAVLDVGDAFRDWTRLADEPIAEPAELVAIDGAREVLGEHPAVNP